MVAAATGPVGATVGQIGKIKGCRTVGIAGGAEKCRYAVETLGFDLCLDHRADDFAEQLAQAQRLMHFSPEARVVERIIKALQLLGREAEAQQAIAHFRTVYPREFADWEREQH